MTLSSGNDRAARAGEGFHSERGADAGGEFRAARNVPDYKNPIDEDTKVRLAIGTSRALMPGAVEAYRNSAARDKGPSTEMEWSYQHILKNRLAFRTDDSPRMPNNEEAPLDDLQRRMSTFRDDASDIDEIDRVEAAEKLKTQQKRRRRISMFGAAGICVSVGVIAAGVVAGTKSGRGNVRKRIDDPAAKLFEECLQDESFVSSRLRDIQSLLSREDTAYPAANELNIRGSYQRAALCWLSEVDGSTFLDGLSQYDLLQIKQRYALASSYYHWNPPLVSLQKNGLSESNWLNNTHVCDWEFVACDDPDNRVTELFLKGVALLSFIPGELGLLSDLVYLRLRRCDLSGAIPSELFSSKKLQVFDLSYNALTGTIPSQIADLQEVRQLELSKNRLSGSMPSELFQLTNLEALDLSENDLTGTLPTEIGALDQLQDLILSSNSFTGQIPVHTFVSPTLWGLSLWGNSFTGSLPNILSNATSLKELHLGSTFLTGTIPDVSRLTLLEGLDLQVTLIEDSMPDISMLTSLHHLDLFQVPITGTIPDKIPTKMMILRLADTRLRGPIPTSIGLLTSLEHLDLSRMLLSGSIPTELGSLSHLTHLNLLEINGFTGTFPTELGRLSKLRSLSLPERSKISGAVPLEICDLLNVPGSQLVQICGPRIPQCDCCTSCTY